MFALGVRYLCGWAMAASDGKVRARAEWPPHPDRLFSTLAAAHFETGADSEERDALMWLESLSDPSLAVEQQWSQRTAVTAFVPVNDDQVPRLSSKKTPSFDIIMSGVRVLPDNRSRQPKGFPVAVPLPSGERQDLWDGMDPVVFFIWPDAQPTANVRAAIDRLSAKMVRIGHSASLVQAWTTDQPPEPTLKPQEGGSGIRLRAIGEGRLRDLEARFPRRPTARSWTAYAPPARPMDNDTGKTVFDPSLLVFRQIGGRRLGLRSTLLVTSALRGMLMTLSPQPVAQWLSGHSADGMPANGGHAAFVPLADIGHKYAEGMLLGLGVAFPRDLNPDDVNGLMDALMRAQEDAYSRNDDGLALYDGALLDWRVEIDQREARPITLQPRSWTEEPQPGATTWATVTPLVLDRFPKKDGDVEALIRLACERVGLKAPIECGAHSVSMFRGVPTAREFPPVPFKIGAAKRMHTHAWMRFAEPVIGPLLLGAGRFKGYGLCRPLTAE